MATKGRVVHEEYRAEIEVATVLILVASSGLRKMGILCAACTSTVVLMIMNLLQT